MKKNLSKKTLLLGLTILPILSSCSCSSSNSYDYSINELSKKYALSDSRILNSKYTSLSAVRSESDDDTNVNQEQLDHRIAAIEDKTQYTLYAVGLKENVVNQTIGLMKKNISNKISEELANKNLPADGQLSQDSLNNVYEYVNTQAQMFGVSVIDFDRLQHDVPSMAARYQIDLTNAGVDKEVAIQQATQYENDILDTLYAANEYLYDDVTYSLLLSEYRLDENSTVSFLKTNKVNIEEKQNNDKDAELETILSWFTYNSSNLLSLREQGLSLLKDYSNNNNGFEAGDTLTPDAISALFNYKYNLARGCDFDQITIKDVPEAEETGEYDQNVIAKTSYEAPLDTFVGYVPYEKNEVFPGYQLHVKILEVEDSTDSHVANLKFAFGISKTNDSHILWEKIDESKIDSVNGFSCKVNDFKLINNITVNKYLNEKESDSSPTLNDKIAFTKLPDDILPNKDGVFFSDSILSRTKIDEILASYKGPEDEDYDLMRNPIILDSAAYEGIPVPSNIEKMLGKQLHTNQELALIANDVNTNTNTLSVHWALIDKGVDANKTTSNNFYVVKDIPWHWKGVEMVSLEVQFNLDQTIQKTINLGRIESAFITKYSEFVENMDFLNQNSSNKNDSRVDEIGDKLTKCKWFVGASALLSVSVGAIMVVYASIAAASLGMNADAIADITIGVIFLAALGIEVILAGIVIGISDANYKKTKKNASLENKNSSFKSTITGNYKSLEKSIATINNSHAQYKDKAEAADKVHKISLETRINTKQLLEDFINANKDEIERVYGKDKFNEVHDFLYQDFDVSSSTNDAVSNMEKAILALTILTVPLVGTLHSILFSIPTLSRSVFDAEFLKDDAEQQDFARLISFYNTEGQKYFQAGERQTADWYSNISGTLTNEAGMRYAQKNMGARRQEYLAHQNLDKSSTLAEYKYPVIITAISVLQLAVQGILDGLLLS